VGHRGSHQEDQGLAPPPSSPSSAVTAAAGHPPPHPPLLPQHHPPPDAPRPSAHNLGPTSTTTRCGLPALRLGA